MRSFTSACTLVAWAVLTLPTVAFAQATIAGVARDSSGGVLPGVTVEASSSALIEKSRAAVTDGSGQYKVVDLRPGTYTVTFSLPGFTGVRREGIVLQGSLTATVNAELRVGALEETLTVTAQSPVVDVQGVKQQRVIGKDVIDRLPSNRNPLGLAVLVPGVVASAQDVGGTNGIGLGNVSVHGGRMTDQRILTDGFSTQNGFCNGNCSAYLPNTGSAQELLVDVAASSAEYATGGIVMNVIPKEGGNDFNGSMFAAFANESLQANNLTQRLKSGGLTTANAVKTIYDYNPALGGADRPGPDLVLHCGTVECQLQLRGRAVLQQERRRPERLDLRPRPESSRRTQGAAAQHRRTCDVAAESEEQDQRVLRRPVPLQLPVQHQRGNVARDGDQSRLSTRGADDRDLVLTADEPGSARGRGREPASGFPVSTPAAQR